MPPTWRTDGRGILKAPRAIERFWINDEEVLRVLAILERTEFGTTFENREGKIELQSANERETSARQENPILFSDDKSDRSRGSIDLVSASYEIPRWNIVNSVRVRIRKYNTSLEATLWTLDDPIEIEAGETVSLVVEHEAGVAVWSTPVSGTDYTASSSIDGTTGRESDLSVNVDERGGELLISLENTGATDLYLRTLDIKGRELTDVNSFSIEEQDQDSIDQYGIRTHPAPETWYTDYRDARTYAQDFLRLLSSPQKRIKARVNANNVQASDLFALEVSSSVNVNWLGLSQNMFVEDITHMPMRGRQARHRVSAVLR